MTLTVLHSLMDGAVPSPGKDEDAVKERAVESLNPQWQDGFDQTLAVRHVFSQGPQPLSGVCKVSELE